MLNKFLFINIAGRLFFCCVEGERLLYFRCYSMVLYPPPLSRCFVYLSFPLTHVWLSEIERKTYGSLLSCFCCQLQRNNVVLAPQLEKHTWCCNPLIIHYLNSLANLSLIFVVVNESLHPHSQSSFYFCLCVCKKCTEQPFHFWSIPPSH